MLIIHRGRITSLRQWEMVRAIEFSAYNTTFAGMSGERPFKKIKKATDLYRLPTDQKVLARVDRVKAGADVERMKNHFKWQKQKDSTKMNSD